jgi:hypothetical protein
MLEIVPSLSRAVYHRLTRPQTVKPPALEKCVSLVRGDDVVELLGFLIRFLIPYFFGIAAFVFIYRTSALREIFLLEIGQADPLLSLLAMPVFVCQRPCQR